MNFRIQPESIARQSFSAWLERVIWIALIALIPLAAIPQGLLDPWWLAAFECVVFALGALWLAKGFLVVSWPIKGWPMLLPLLALCVYVGLQAVPWRGRALSADPIGTRSVLLELMALVVFGQLLRQCTSTARRARGLIYTTIGVVVGSACFGLLRLILQRGAPGVPLFGLPAEGYGQLLNRNYFATMLVMALGLDLGLMVAGGIVTKQLLLHSGIVILLAASVVFTNSRGGIFAMMVLVILLAAQFVVRRSRWSARAASLNSSWRRVGSLALGLLLICCLVFAMAIAVTKLGGDPLQNRMEKLSTEVDEDSSGVTNGRRADIWEASWQLIKAHPIAGVGFGAYRTAIPFYHNASGAAVPETAINGYLDLLAAGGLIGCAISVWFIVAARQRFRFKRKPKGSFEYAARLGSLAGLLGLAIHSLVDNGLNVPINAIILTVLIVIFAADWETSKRHPGHPARRDFPDGSNVLLGAGTKSRATPDQ